VDGVALSSLIIKGMMKLCGTWDDQCEKFLEVEHPGIEARNNQIIAGIDLLFMTTVIRLGSK